MRPKPTTLADLVMDAIHWETAPEGSKFWNPLCIRESWKELTAKNTQLTKFLVQRYPNPIDREEQSQKNYRHTLKLILKYEDRFGTLPSVELLKELLDEI